MSDAPVSYATFPSNDRTYLQDRAQAERAAEREDEGLRQYEMLGAGWALAALSFWRTMATVSADEGQETFSREERLQLLLAALQGR